MRGAAARATPADRRACSVCAQPPATATPPRKDHFWTHTNAQAHSRTTRRDPAHRAFFGLRACTSSICPRSFRSRVPRSTVGVLSCWYVRVRAPAVAGGGRAQMRGIDGERGTHLLNPLARAERAVCARVELAVLAVVALLLQALVVLVVAGVAVLRLVHGREARVERRRLDDDVRLRLLLRLRLRLLRGRLGL